MKAALIRAVVALFLMSALAYVGDYLSLRIPIPKNRQPFSSVLVTPSFEIHQKNGKVEYQFNPPEPQSCVNSLCPHFGYVPCWYLRRHPERNTVI